MDNAREDLRAALRAKQSEDEAAAARKTQLDDDLSQAREAFDRKEAAVMSHLRDAAGLTVQALATNGTQKPIAMGPAPTGLGRLLRPQAHVEGWKIDLGDWGGGVLQPNGT